MSERDDPSKGEHEPPADDPNAMSDAPAPIDVDVDPDDERLESIDESVERAAW